MRREEGLDATLCEAVRMVRWENQRTLTPMGPRQGKRMQGCSRVGRPPRTPLDVVETQEEQKIWGLEELGFGEKVKMIKIVDWFVF